MRTTPSLPPPVYMHRAFDGELCTATEMFTAEQMREYARQVLEVAAQVCDTTPPYPFRPSIEAAHAIRALARA